MVGLGKMVIFVNTSDSMVLLNVEQSVLKEEAASMLVQLATE